VQGDRNVKPSYCLPGALPREQSQDLVELSQRRLIGGRASARAWRIAATVWHQTHGFDRGWDSIFVEELGRLANINDRRDAGRAIKECAALGALEWEPSAFIPPKGQKGRPSLIGLPGAPKAGAHCPHLGDGKAGALCPHNKALTRDAMSHDSTLSTGTHRSIGPHDQVLEGSEARQSEGWHAERPAPREDASCTTPGCDGVAFSDGLCMECDRERFYSEQRY
jgi:hypothetical protein